MHNEPQTHFFRGLSRGALFALVVLPFVPEILIVAARIYAESVGCQVDASTACALGPPSASGVIRIALQVANFIGSKFADDNIVAAWLVLGFLLIVIGWSRLSSRLLLALAISLIFGFLPYFGPMLSIGQLENRNCHPNEGGIGPCKIYGGDVDSAAHDAVRLGWRFFYGAPLALGVFLAFVLVLLGVHLIARRRSAPEARPPA